MSDEMDRAGIEAKLTLDVLLGRIGQTLDGVSEGLATLHEFLSANKVRSPLARKINKSYVAAAAAATYSFVDMGAPNNGSVWDVRRYYVGGPDPFAALAGVSVLAFVTQNPPQDSATEPPFLDIVNAPSALVPNSANWARDQLTLLPGEHLVFCLKGLGNSQQILASLQVEQWREDDKASWAAP